MSAQIIAQLKVLSLHEATLSDQDIVAVLSWIKAQWPVATRKQHDQMNTEAAKTSRQ